MFLWHFSCQLDTEITLHVRGECAMNKEKLRLCTPASYTWCLYFKSILKSCIYKSCILYRCKQCFVLKKKSASPEIFVPLDLSPTTWRQVWYRFHIMRYRLWSATSGMQTATKTCLEWSFWKSKVGTMPIASICGILMYINTWIVDFFVVNVGRHTIHGCYGMFWLFYSLYRSCRPPTIFDLRNRSNISSFF